MRMVQKLHGQDKPARGGPHRVTVDVGKQKKQYLEYLDDVTLSDVIALMQIAPLRKGEQKTQSQQPQSQPQS